MSFCPIHSKSSLLNSELRGVPHITNRTTAALKMKDCMVNKNATLDDPMKTTHYPSIIDKHLKSFYLFSLSLFRSGKGGAIKMSIKKSIHKTTCLHAKREGGRKSMKRFIVLAVFALALTLMLGGTAMAYTDYIPYLAKGTTGAVPLGSASTDDYGVSQNETPRVEMPDTYSAYALGCFWCHGWEKRAYPNDTNAVILSQVLTSPTVTNNIAGLVTPVKIGNIPAGTAVPNPYDVQALSTADSGYTGVGVGAENEADANALGNTLVGPVAGSRWTNLLEQYGQPYGPHGGYSNTTDRCKVCHDVHAAAGSKRLTAGNTAEDICETCHDFTQGISIYGAIKEATGVEPQGGHRIQNLWDGNQTTDTAAVGAAINSAAAFGARDPNSLSVDFDRSTPAAMDPISGGSADNDGTYNTSGTLIPGYIPGWDNQAGLDYPQTGGVFTYTSASLASRESRLTCTDCHTPHGNTSMRPFKGDRVRLGSAILVAACLIQPLNITIAPTFATVQTGPTIGGVAWQGTGGDMSTVGSQIDLVGALGLPAALGMADTLANRTAIHGLAFHVPTYSSQSELQMDMDTSWAQRFAVLLNPVMTDQSPTIPNSGLALAVELYLAGAIDLGIDAVDGDAADGGIGGLGATNGIGLAMAALTRVPSNKLLRDYVNEFDLRQAKMGGRGPSTTVDQYGADSPTAEQIGDFNNYNETANAPTVSGGGVSGDANDGNPYNNGQMFATAEYGSGFCAACHRGRIGNYAGLVDDQSTASRDAARIDDNFTDFEMPPNTDGLVAVSGTVDVNYSTYDTMSDADTCLNHPTLMNTAYRNVGPMNPLSYNNTGTNGDPGSYVGLTDGLALSNQGFSFWPVNTLSHPDGRLGATEAERPTAPICQQCHEDSRDVEQAFSYGDTDKIVPFATPVNAALSVVTQTYPAYVTPLAENPDGSDPNFIYAGNPQFQNFPHETVNYRLLAEGGDSNAQGGGSNDDLCLNCHVPGSTVRPGKPGATPIIFNTLVKDFNGFQE